MGERDKGMARYKLITLLWVCVLVMNYCGFDSKRDRELEGARERERACDREKIWKQILIGVFWLECRTGTSFSVFAFSLLAPRAFQPNNTITQIRNRRAKPQNLVALHRIRSKKFVSRQWRNICVARVAAAQIARSETFSLMQPAHTGFRSWIHVSIDRFLDIGEEHANFYSFLLYGPEQNVCQKWRELDVHCSLVANGFISFLVCGRRHHRRCCYFY